ncbi:hypothetical protein HYH03_017934 [Edaphochlamys debaryana]|uniref:Protein kinase domain-containing protein n=1 Tax=Edaphochlamys debaryana TaxID=47281 RepID=A0A835XN74_9CHLO|nr:hypothetical protein HYH03_017934 [Edaphochlamys debaryana]|eukprot:KAG2483199.1 hypothetical protein HYH03_017934 [Edaphochlamys debaryana]
MASAGPAAHCAGAGDALPMPPPPPAASHAPAALKRALVVPPWKAPPGMLSNRAASTPEVPEAILADDGWQRLVSSLQAACPPSSKNGEAAAAAWHVLLVPLMLGPQLVGAMLLALPGSGSSSGGKGRLSASDLDRRPVSPGQIGLETSSHGPLPHLDMLCTEPGALEALGACVAECCLGPVLPAVEQACMYSELCRCAPSIKHLSSTLALGLSTALHQELHIDLTVRLGLLPRKEASTGLLFESVDASGSRQAGNACNRSLSFTSRQRPGSRSFQRRMSTSAKAAGGPFGSAPLAVPLAGAAGAAQAARAGGMSQSPGRGEAWGLTRDPSASAGSTTLRLAIQHAAAAAAARSVKDPLGSRGLGEDELLGPLHSKPPGSTLQADERGASLSSSRKYKRAGSVGGSALLDSPRALPKATTLPMPSSLAASLLRSAVCNISGGDPYSSALGARGLPSGGSGTGMVRITNTPPTVTRVSPMAMVGGEVLALHQAGTVLPDVPAYLQDADLPSADVFTLMRRPGTGTGFGSGSVASAVVSPASLVVVAGCWQARASHTGGMPLVDISGALSLSPKGAFQSTVSSTGMRSVSQPAFVLYISSALPLPAALLGVVRDRALGLLELLLPAASRALTVGAAADEWGYLSAVLTGDVHNGSLAPSLSAAFSRVGLGVPSTVLLDAEDPTAPAAGQSPRHFASSPTPAGGSRTTSTAHRRASVHAVRGSNSRLSGAGADLALNSPKGSAADASFMPVAGISRMQSRSLLQSSRSGVPVMTTLSAQQAAGAMGGGQESRTQESTLESMLSTELEDGEGEHPNASFVELMSTVMSEGPNNTAQEARQAQLDIMVSTFHTALSRARNEAAPLGGAHAEDDIAALRLVKTIGQGGCSVVVLGRLHAMPVAVKVILPPDDEVKEEEPLPGTARSPGVGSAWAPRGAAGMSTTARQAQLRLLMRGARELAVMTTMSHPNVVQVYSYCTRVIVVHSQDETPVPQLQAVPDGETPAEDTPLCTALIMEYCDMGSLADAIDTGVFARAARTAAMAAATPLPRSFSTARLGGLGADGLKGTEGGGPVSPSVSQTVASIAGTPAMRALYLTLLEVALALRHLHSMNLVHCDVKPANVLLRSSATDPRGFTAKLTDFGFVNLLEPECNAGGSGESELQAGGVKDGTARATLRVQDTVGTVTHMAPELFVRGSVVDSSVDCYAFGILMWEVYTGRAPYPEYANSGFAEVPHKVVREGLRPRFPADTPLHFKILAQECWQALPGKRPAASGLVSRLQELMDLACGLSGAVANVRGDRAATGPARLVAAVGR